VATTSSELHPLFCMQALQRTTICTFTHAELALSEQSITSDATNFLKKN